MTRAALLQALNNHPMAGWRNVRPFHAPALDGEGRLLWGGIGGSHLPSETLVCAFGTADQKARWTPLISPEYLDLELRPTDQLVFASKSGKTLELWTWISRLQARGGWKGLDNTPIAITQDDQNPLATLARSEGWPILPIPLDVGGRFSVFTSIGTLPLAWMGRDAKAFLDGAGAVSAQMVAGAGPWWDRVWAVEERLFEAWQKGVGQWVLMPYALRLESLSAWWVQLVGESLGKVAKDGSRRGLTAIRAVGPADQHSQLQRWLAGPPDMGVIVSTVGGAPTAERLDPPSSCPYPALAGLDGARILAAQAQGTADALESAGVPVIRWNLEGITEAELGAFQMAWQFIVGLLGFHLELDPFDQPAVEEGKKRTFAMLGL